MKTQELQYTIVRGSGWGVTNISCQLKLWTFVSYQLMDY